MGETVVKRKRKSVVKKRKKNTEREREMRERQRQRENERVKKYTIPYCPGISETISISYRSQITQCLLYGYRALLIRHNLLKLPTQIKEV